jgi:hypothetical protein
MCVEFLVHLSTDIDIYIPAFRRVLHLNLVTQCAVLEDFRIFLVLTDGVSTNDLHRYKAAG